MPARIATYDTLENDVWTNVHLTVKKQFNCLYIVKRPLPGDSNLILEDMRATVVLLQQILGDAVAKNKQLRCLGGGWSLSDAAATDGWLINTFALNLFWTFVRSEVHAEYKKDIAGLYLFQCGITIQKVNEILERHGRSLITSGASNGQTIAGAIATGTHGSAFQFGAMPEYVVGFHLITAPDKVIWLERDGCPVVSDSFAAQLGAQIVRDDDLFNAVLVSFGSMGIVAGILIETEPKYLFEAERRHIAYSDTMRNAMNTLNFVNLEIPNTGVTPWHFEITFNPHKIDGDAYVSTLFKKPFNAYPPYPKKFGKIRPGESFLHVIGSLTNILPTAGIKLIMSNLMNGNLPKEGPILGTSGETFGTTFTEGKAMSMELGVAMENATRVLDIMRNLPEVENYAGVFSFRWVKQTTAMLGWTKFPTTATIEFNAAHNDRTLEFYHSVWNALEANNIPYTLHWGQMHNFTPARIRKMYGDAVDKWIECREKLLSPQVRAVFMSQFLECTGLGTPSAVPPPNA